MIATRRLVLPTARPTEFIDLTPRLQAEVTGAGLQTGRLYLQSLHTTLGLTVNENEPLLLEDLKRLLERLVPQGARYQHDDLALRAGVAAHEPANGHAHGRLMLLQPHCTVLVEDGALVLGPWQSVFAVELDGPRERQLSLQLDGEFEPRRDPQGDRRLIDLELARQLAVDPAPVRAPMQRLVDAGGKRLRPHLVMLSSRLGPSYDPLRASQLASAIELIHHATLVHDDYVDRSDTRRGRATVASAEGPARAIAVGDYYFAKATRLIAELGHQKVVGTIAAAMEEICLSQIDDVRLRGLYPGDYATYLRVVRGKTAALIASACRAGAELSDAGEDVSSRLGRYGDLLGTAFQMADDLLDYSQTSGKPIGQDIRERVIALPLIYAAEDERLGPTLRALLQGPLGEEQVDEVRRMVVETGALERVEEGARALVEAAIREVEELDVDGLRPALIDLARSAVDRSK
jgi:secondary thiamine-phosphate synthase enzyme